MQPTELGHLVKSAACRVCGWEDAAQPTQRRVLAQLIRDCKSADCLILCEPSLARSSQRPPDVVLIDPVAGLHVIEVKGHDLAGIEAIEYLEVFGYRQEGLVAELARVLQRQQGFSGTSH